MKLPKLFTASRATDTPDISFTAPVEIEARAGTDRPITATIELYDGHVMRIAGMGNVVVDLSQMVIPEQVPLLADHRNEVSAVIGYGSPTTDGRTLRVVGTILKSSKVAQEVVAMAKEGMRFEASQGTHPEGLKRIKAGNEIRINGRTITAPEGGLLVAAPSQLKEATITPIGAGSNTATIINSKHGGHKMPFWKQNKGGSTTPQDNADDNHQNAEQIEAAWLADVERICGDSHPSIKAKALQEGWSAERVEAAISASELATLRASRGTNGRSALMGVSPLSTKPNPLGSGADHRDILGAAFLLHTNQSKLAEDHYGERACEAAADLRIANAIDLCRAAVMLDGRQVPHGQDALIRAAFSTDALSDSVAAGTEKIAAMMFRDTSPVMRTVTGRKSPSNFLEHKVIRPYHSGGEFDELAADGEIRHSVPSDESYAVQVKTFAKMFAVTRQTIVNDGIGAIGELAQEIGRNGARTIAAEAARVWLSNPGSFFSVGNGNKITDALDVDGLGVAIKTLRNFTDSDDKPIDAMPMYLLVPPSLEATARQVLNSTEVNRSGDNSATANPWHNSLQLQVEPRLESTAIHANASTTGWYVVAAPSQVPAFVLSFLNGNEGITVEQDSAGFSVLGQQWRGYVDFGVDDADTRGAVFSDGTA